MNYALHQNDVDARRTQQNNTVKCPENAHQYGVSTDTLFNRIKFNTQARRLPRRLPIVILT